MYRFTSYIGLLGALMLLNGYGLTASAPAVNSITEEATVPETETSVSAQELTGEQQQFVAWAEDRFAAAGLVLPEIKYVFHDGLDACGWKGGLYRPRTGVVEICNPSPRTLIHELAHAWETTNVSDEARADFMELRGLEVWHDRSVPWSERGVEQAAEIVTWGVEEESRLVQWTEPDGSVTFRLLTIPDSSVEELVAAYELLTGLEPTLRDPEEWEEVEWSDFSPEAVRVRG